MRVYSAMPIDEFVAWLRDAAVAQGASPQIIHKLDEINHHDYDELDELREQVKELENTIADLDERLEAARAVK